ncbi:Dipeptidyl-peptidase 5 [Savitreella phatthalungensis]
MATKRYGILDFLETQYRSTAAINGAGTLALYTRSRYDIGQDKTSQSICIMEVGEAPKERDLVQDDKISEPVWISDEQFLYLRTDAERTSLHKYHIGKLSSTELHAFDGVVSNLRFHKSGLLGMTALVHGDSGAMVNADGLREDPRVLQYDKLWVRHWDSWVDTKDRKQSIFVARPKLRDDDVFELDDPVNVLHESGLESPIAPFGDAGDYSLSGSHVAFVAKDPHVNAATNTTSNVYITSISGDDHGPTKINNAKSATSNPRFSPDGQFLLFLEMREPQYEAARNHLMIYHTTSKLTHEVDLPEHCTVLGAEWGPDSSCVYVQLQVNMSSHYFEVKLHHGESLGECVPIRQPDRDSDDGVSVSTHGDILLSGSSLWYNRHYAIRRRPTARADGVATQTVEWLFRKPAQGLSEKMVAEFFPRRAGRAIPCAVTFPRNYDPSKKYPLIVITGGGPQSCLGHSWSKRWNMLVMSSHETDSMPDGFMTLQVNRAGSTGCGQKYTDEIVGEYGTVPYDDVFYAFRAALEKYPAIDKHRCVSAGASWGGFAQAWYAGKHLSRCMRTLVSHCGMFDIRSFYFSTEELYFPEHDMRGKPWDKDVATSQYERFSPSRYLENWKTPMLVIHGERDYRVPIHESLGMFTALQRQGIKSRLLVFRDENHWIMKPKDTRAWYEGVMGWIEDRLSDKPYDGFDPDIEPDWQTKEADK